MIQLPPHLILLAYITKVLLFGRARLYDGFYGLACVPIIHKTCRNISRDAYMDVLQLQLAVFFLKQKHVSANI